MRRISRNWDELATQLTLAVQGINGEPAWPGSAPSNVEVQAASASIRDLTYQIIGAENDLQILRSRLSMAMDDGTRIMRMVDFTSHGLYAQGDPKLVAFGMRPIDRIRNSPGPTPKIERLALADGAGSGAISGRWKPVSRANYEVQWYADQELETLIGAMVATKSEAQIPALAPGLQIWLRVRALRGGRYGEWSDVATRIANV